MYHILIQEDYIPLYWHVENPNHKEDILIYLKATMSIHEKGI